MIATPDFSTVPDVIAGVLRSWAAQISRFGLKEHRPTGEHAAITADSLTLNGPLILAVDSPDALTATYTHYEPKHLSTVSVLRLRASGAITLRGLTPVKNRLLALRNIGANNITLPHEDTAATENYRFQLPNSANVVLGQYDGVLLWYDWLSGRWTCFQQ